MTVITKEAQSTDESGAITRVDCDVHPNFRDGLTDLIPYLSAADKRRVGMGQGASWTQTVGASLFSIPANVMYIHPAGAMRRDTAVDGRTPASMPDIVIEQLLDRHNIDRAVLLCANVLGLGGLVDPDIAVALARAYNLWLYENWLKVDERFRGGILVPPQDPEAAVQLIEEFQGQSGFIQVNLPMDNRLLGERHFWPIYQAAADASLPVAVHPNGIDGIFRTGPPTAGGTPTYYAEWHAGLTQIFQANVISLVCQGTFERYPNLRVVVTEGGCAWLPDVMWRLDSNWRALRDELPWLNRAPSEYIVEHFRFTTQPFVEPKKRTHLAALCEIISAERILMFSTDYPHWDFDDPDRALRQLPEKVKERVFAKNARELYGDRLE